MNTALIGNLPDGIRASCTTYPLAPYRFDGPLPPAVRPANSTWVAINAADAVDAEWRELP